jgi:hypothetical protein
MQPLLKDGTPFKLGMTLYKVVGWDFLAIPTSPETHEIDSFEYCGEMIHCINQKGSRQGTDLLGFYPSKEAYYDEKIAKLEERKALIDKEITGILAARNKIA